jgi:tetratricopeptide (TPR) repeat protein
MLRVWNSLRMRKCRHCGLFLSLGLMLGLGSIGLAAGEPALQEAEAALLEKVAELPPAQAAAALLAATSADSSAALFFARGVFHLRAEENGAALAAFRAAYARAPDFHRARLNAAKLLLMQGDYEPAARELRALLATAQSSEPGELYSLLARCELARGQFLSAEAACRQALLWLPEDLSSRLLLIQALAEQGRLEDAALLARQEVLFRPGEAWLWGIIANADLQAGRRPEAMATLELARRFKVNTDTMQEALFDLFLSEKLYRMAAQQLENCSGNGEPAPGALLLRGAQELLAAGAEEEARRVAALINAGTALTPEEASAYARLQAELALRGGDAAAASSILRQTISENPLDANALIALGRLALDEGELLTAEDYFARALTLADSTQDAHMGLARVAMARENWPEALEQLQKLRKIAPSPELDESIRQLQGWMDKRK